MQDLKYALVQANQIWEDKQKNYENYTSLLKEVKYVDLILLPEMFNTGFSMNAPELAEEIDGDAINWLKETSRNKNCAIYTSVIVKEGNHFFNRACFIQPDGTTSFYDKRKTFGLAGEDKIYNAGDKEEIVEYGGWKFNLQICYDLRFPEIVRNRILSNGVAAYDVILYVANWPKRRSAHWKALLQARAIENQCFTLGLNRVGTDGTGLEYSGDSMCVDPLGEITAAIPGEQMVLVGIMKLEVLREVREKLPFLKDI
jgi:omega-amidase